MAADMGKSPEAWALHLQQLVDDLDGSRPDGGITLPTRDEAGRLATDLAHVLFPQHFRTSGEAAACPAGRLWQLGQVIWDLAFVIHRVHRHECSERDLCPVLADSLRRATALGEDLPHLRNVLVSDAEAAVDGDPAAHDVDEVIATYPGFFATLVHRLAHSLHAKDVPLLPRLFSEWAHGATGIDIHPGAAIGPRFFIDHGTGVVIGETTVIGQSVTLYQGVTLGALNFPRDGDGRVIRGQKRHPTIEDRVVIYAEATILGGATVVGHDSEIGGNVWLTKSVPPYTKVTSPSRLEHVQRAKPEERKFVSRETSREGEDHGPGGDTP